MKPGELPESLSAEKNLKSDCFCRKPSYLAPKGDIGQKWLTLPAEITVIRRSDTMALHNLFTKNPVWDNMAQNNTLPIRQQPSGYKWKTQALAQLLTRQAQHPEPSPTLIEPTQYPTNTNKP